MNRSLVKNIFAVGWSKASIMLYRLVEIPILLSSLGVETYGRWLIIASLPTWLAIANLGFGSVAANDISMLMAAKEYKKAKILFSTTIFLITIIFFAGSIIAFLVIPEVKWYKILESTVEKNDEYIWAVIWLMLSVLVLFYKEIFSARFRAAEKAHINLFITGFKQWLDIVAILVVLQFSNKFNYIALAMLVSSIIYILFLNYSSWRQMSQLTFNRNEIDPKIINRLFRKGLAFQAFPLGNAILFQGNLLIVQLILGPIAVSLFGTTRTLVRSINQLLELVNQAIWPELSIKFGLGDLKEAAKLHRIGVITSIAASYVSLIFMFFFGQFIYSYWTNNSIQLPQNLFLLFLLPIPFNALWYTSSVTHIACNKHEGLAIRFFVATITSLGTCAALSHFLGMEGAAVSTLIADLILIPYVFKKSLELTGDTWTEFFKNTTILIRSTPFLLKKKLIN